MMKKETEVFGVVYERYSLGKKLKTFARKNKIKTVLEMPAHGAKAMPSIYSAGFAGCVRKITLVNGNRAYEKEWKKINPKARIEWTEQKDILHTALPERSYDFVWNFAYIPTSDNPDGLIEEMKRISKRYVAIFSVNAGNIGFPIHRAVHRKTGIPWTHGDIRYNNRKFIRKKLEEHGLKVVESGFVDCPVWPDSLGFRDVRLHRMNIDFNQIEWESPYMEMLAAGQYPVWVKLVYAVEKIPFPKFIKSIYSHINYTIAEVEADEKK